MTEQLDPQQQILKSAIRGKIFTRSELMRGNLLSGTQFVYSKTYPTQVINIPSGRYIRINENDIHEETISDLLSLMLGIDSYKEDTSGEIPFDPVELIEQSVTSNLEYDAVSLDSIIERDEYMNISNLEELPLKPQTYSSIAPVDPEKPTPEESADEDSINCDLAAGGDMTSDAKALGTTLYTPNVSNLETQVHGLVELDHSLKELQTHTDKSEFHDNRSVLNIDDLKKLQKKVSVLLRSFRGSKGKTKNMTPSKRMSAKDIACDRDRVYIRSKLNDGKHIKLNLVIDMSGSMSGSPLKNAVSLIWLFNQLAKEGYVQMKVRYSSSSSNYMLTLPAQDSEILSLCNLGGSEGLAHNIIKHRDSLANVNCICVTDGDIVDAGIEKTFWSKNRIVSTGVYVNSSIKTYSDYSKNMDKWFNHTVIRRSLDDLIEWLVKTGIK